MDGIVIISLLGLWDDINTNCVKFQLTKRLNQDCIENLFSKIRANNCNIVNPGAKEFRSCMKKVKVNHLFHHSKGSNCEEDMDFFLFTFDDLKSIQRYDQSLDQNDPREVAIIGVQDNDLDDETEPLLGIITPEIHHSQIYVQRENDATLAYFSGYIVKKVYSKCKCKCLVIG